MHAAGRTWRSRMPCGSDRLCPADEADPGGHGEGDGAHAAGDRCHAQWWAAAPSCCSVPGATAAACHLRAAWYTHLRGGCPAPYDCRTGAAYRQRPSPVAYAHLAPSFVAERVCTVRSYTPWHCRPSTSERSGGHCPQPVNDTLRTSMTSTLFLFVVYCGLASLRSVMPFSCSLLFAVLRSLARSRAGYQLFTVSC